MFRNGSCRCVLSVAPLCYSLLGPSTVHSFLRNYIGKLMEQVKTGITFSHIDETGKEVSEHVASSKEDVRQADDLATVFTPAVLKVRTLETVPYTMLDTHTVQYPYTDSMYNTRAHLEA